MTYVKENAPYQKDWKGKRIVAIDGSLLNLPHTEDIENEFGGVTNQHEKVVSARCSFAYDVCNELVLDAQIAPRRSCEKDLAIIHLPSLNSSTDILVFDRGYPSQWLKGLLMKENFKFCFRLSTAWKNASAQLEGEENETIGINKSIFPFPAIIVSLQYLILKLSVRIPFKAVRFFVK